MQRKINIDGELRQRTSIDRHTGRLAAGKIAAVQREFAGPSSDTGRRQDVIDVRHRANRKAIDIVGTPAKKKIVKPDEISAVSRQNDVDDRIAPQLLAGIGQSSPVRAGQLEDGRELRVEIGRAAGGGDPLPLLSLEAEIIDVGLGADRAVDDLAERQFVRFVAVVVRLRLAGFIG